jgi:adsorption protein B
MVFVSGYYGVKQGLLSLPRLLWGNLVNFLANWRAIKQIVQTGDPRRVAWDKTTHDFPSIGGENRAQRSLDEMLVAAGAVSEERLRELKAHPVDGLKLGSALIHEGVITPAQLARPVAEQLGVACESVEPDAIALELIDAVPAKVALHYAVLPLRVEGGVLVLASEGYVDPVSLAAIARKLGRPVRYVIAHKGQVTVGLRRWYAPPPGRERDPRSLLDAAARSGRIGAERARRLWESYVSRQVMLGEILVAQGHLDEVAFKALLLSHARSEKALGAFLVEQGVIGQDTLDRLLSLQSTLQPDIAALLEKEAAPPVQLVPQWTERVA